VTASLLEQLADLPKAEVDALIRAMAPGEAYEMLVRLAPTRAAREAASCGLSCRSLRRRLAARRRRRPSQIQIYQNPAKPSQARAKRIKENRLD